LELIAFKPQLIGIAEMAFIDDDNDDARTTSTSFMTQQPTCGWMNSWKGGWGAISMTMVTRIR
jgi:hypothetical protein